MTQAPADAGRRRWTGASRLPLCTALLVAACLAAELPVLAERLSLERAALARGELWRALSGHLVHGIPRLLALDLTALALLGAWVEHHSRALLTTALLAAAVLASVAVLVATDYEHYAGSSALSMGLLAALAVRELREGGGGLALALGGLVTVKLLLEACGAWPAGLGDLPPDVELAFPAHAAGALGGACAGWAIAPGRSRSDPPPSA